jgi:hypothetical protein
MRMSNNLSARPDPGLVGMNMPEFIKPVMSDKNREKLELPEHSLQLLQALFGLMILVPKNIKYMFYILEPFYLSFYQLVCVQSIKGIFRYK